MGPEFLKRPRLILLIAAVALAIVATILAVSGGFRATVGGFRISARSPEASTVAALIAAGAWWLLARRHAAIAADLESAWHALEQHATRIIGAIALMATIVAATFATRSAAGADASGYLSQAAHWAAGQEPVHFEFVAEEFGVLDGWMTTPLGWQPWHLPGAIDRAPGVQVPTYAPGLPLLMAVPHAIAGLDGASAVIVAAAAVATWATGMIMGGVAGIMAAMFLALAPVFVYQSIQPMSDVPVTAAWMVCFLLLASRHGQRVWPQAAAGVACALAVLIRPNLAPLAIVPFLISRRRWWFAMPVIAAGAFLGIVQTFWYGSPFRSGYGTADELFSVANIVPNAGRYAQWLVATSPVLFFAPLGFFRVRNEPYARALLVFALLVIASYLVYAVFDHWSYLRFLLPALAVFAIFAALELHRWIERWPPAARFPIFTVLMLGIAAHGLFVARAFDTFRLRDQLRRVAQVAAAINRTAPPNAVIIAGEQSGSMRYYTRRTILRWEAATADQLPNAIEVLMKDERPIYLVLDAWEMEPFRARFRGVGPAELDWPPMLEAGSSHRTLAWNLADRARFQLGQRVNTVRIP